MKKTIYKYFALKLMASKPYNLFLRYVFPKLRLTNSYGGIPGSKYSEAYQYLRKGSCVLTVDKYKASAIVPGIFSHAAPCVDLVKNWEPGKYEIGEMTAPGYTKSFFYDVCREATRIVIIDCVDFNEVDRFALCEQIKKYEGSKYDNGFSLGVKDLYCSELFYQAEILTVGKFKFDLSDLIGLGIPYISPDGLLFAKNAVVIYDSEYELTGMTGPVAEEYCKSKGLIK